MTDIIHKPTLEEAFQENLVEFLEENQEIPIIQQQSNIIIGTSSDLGIEPTDEGGIGLSPQGKMSMMMGGLGGQVSIFISIKETYSIVPSIQLCLDSEGEILTASEIRELEAGTPISRIRKQLYVHELPLEILRKLPKFLSDTVLFTNKILIPLDHYLYWAWTNTTVSQYFDIAPATSGDFESSETSDQLRSLLDDFGTLVTEMLTPIQQHIENDIHSFENPMENPSVENTKAGLKLLMNLGFSVLDGLMTHHCDKINQVGEIKSEYLPDTGSNLVISNGRGYTQKLSQDHPRPNFYTKLILWMDNNASESVRETLLQIDGLSSEHLDKVKEAESIEEINRGCYNRYDETTLLRKISGISKEDFKKYQSFLYALTELRNRNIHGSNRTMALGAVVLNLCCLLIWDMVEESEYQSLLAQSIPRLHFDPQADFSRSSQSVYPFSELSLYFAREQARSRLNTEEQLSKSIFALEYGIEH